MDKDRLSMVLLSSDALASCGLTDSIAHPNEPVALGAMSTEQGYPRFLDAQNRTKGKTWCPIGALAEVEFATQRRLPSFFGNLWTRGSATE
jgi:hypothetical protein